MTRLFTKENKMKITDQKILAALQNGKRIRQPNFTSNDEFFLSSNGFTITSSGRIFVTGKENAPIPMQIDLLASDDWEIVNDDETQNGNQWRWQDEQ